ncbi:MAG: ATP-dependent Clp protease ATP-binding subunit [Candidatus Edwardsbacteria bacterium]|nr:ATP-dependent Clp protease ATP-binding subunit [Candidatus Edwardsbacteria bacterium]
MKDNRFTERARRVLFLAREEARRLQHDYIGTEHILLAALREGEGVAVAVLLSLGVSTEQIRRKVEELMPKGGQTILMGELPFNLSARRAMELAVEEAKTLQHNYVGTEHLLLGLMEDQDGIASRALVSLGLSTELMRSEIMRLLSSEPGSSPTLQSNGQSKTPALDYFCRDLTRLAQDGKLDPVIGRSREIERVIQILSRRKKNNPLLIGEAGVGKTAIIEGLAQKIISGEVPEPLLSKRVMALDLAAVVAGTKYRGQFEERMKALMNELRQTQDNIIFLDELHTIVGAGGAEGALDASNMLKPALARGEMQCVGATTLDEYRKHIEKDGALERRFQSIIVEAPSVDESLKILKGLQERYQDHHKVKYSDEAIESAVRLSDRYITDRYLPDKAIDVLDEAGSRARLSTSEPPAEIKFLENQLKDIKAHKVEAVKGQDYEKAATLRDSERNKRREIERLREAWKKSRDLVAVKITQEDIAYVISRWTGIPIVKLEEKESARLLRMEEELRKRVVGQDQALEAVSRAVRRSRAGIRDTGRPMGSFIFLGPTGVGKTELARVLASFLFGDENALIRVDMSEYMEKFAVSRMVGAPPGYVGYEEGGQLTEKIRRKPYSVVLLDEIEKAHPDVFNMLLQVLEDGQLTDSYGRKVSFKNAVLIMTSNLGAREIKKGVSLGFQKNDQLLAFDQMKDKVMSELKKTFNPEFLNRVDEVVVFNSLGRPEMGRIVDILMGQLSQRLKEKNITIGISPQAKELLVARGFDPTYGARPLRRTIQRMVEDPLSQEILKADIKFGNRVLIEVEGEVLKFVPQSPGKTRGGVGKKPPRVKK